MHRVVFTSSFYLSFLKTCAKAKQSNTLKWEYGKFLPDHTFLKILKFNHIDGFEQLLPKMALVAKSYRACFEPFPWLSNSFSLLIRYIVGCMGRSSHIEYHVFHSRYRTLWKCTHFHYLSGDNSASFLFHTLPLYGTVWSKPIHVHLCSRSTPKLFKKHHQKILVIA